VVLYTAVVSFETPWLEGGRIVRGVMQRDTRPRDFIPRLVNATFGAAVKPVLLLPQ